MGMGRRRRGGAMGGRRGGGSEVCWEFWIHGYVDGVHEGDKGRERRALLWCCPGWEFKLVRVGCSGRDTFRLLGEELGWSFHWMHGRTF